MTATNATSTQSTTVAPTLPDISSKALSQLDAAAFALHAGEVNTAFAAVETQWKEAWSAKVALVTEQIARHLAKTTPTATVLFVRAVAEFHVDESGLRDPHCDGHNEALSAFQATTVDGTLVADFSETPSSPLHYLVERLTPYLGVTDLVLNVPARQWAHDCTND